jgi:hypothetical protein
MLSSPPPGRRTCTCHVARQAPQDLFKREQPLACFPSTIAGVRRHHASDAFARVHSNEDRVIDLSTRTQRMKRIALLIDQHGAPS